MSGRMAKRRRGGWIDLQVNGRVGVSFTDRRLSPEGVLKVVEALRDGGTEAFLPTIVTCPDSVAMHCLRTIVKARRLYPECERRILGLHMEGPFLSEVPGYSGAHPTRWMRDCDFAMYERWQDVSEGLIRIVTIDGARAGAEAFTRKASGAGTVVSLGHTPICRTEDLDRFAAAGAKALTHLGNGLPNDLPRHHNIMWSGLAHPTLVKMFIADGFHLPRAILHCYVRAAPIDRMVVVSDCAYPGGCPPGRYVNNGCISVLEPDGFLRSPRTRSLSGSSCLLSDCVKVLNSPEVGLSMADCTRLCRDNPLKLLGLA